MSGERKAQTLALSLIALVVIGVMIARDPLTGSVVAADAGTKASATPPPRCVLVRSPERRTIKRVVRVPADIVAWRVATLAARVTGYVKSISVDVGSHVAAGVPVAVLEVPDLEAALASAQSRLIEASARVTEAKSALQAAQAAVRQASAETGATRSAVERFLSEKEKAEADLAYRTTARDRLDAVLAARPQLVSQDSVEEARGKAAMAKASVAVETSRVEESRALVTLAEAREAAAGTRVHAADAAIQAAKGAELAARVGVVQAETTLRFATLRAPFAGTVTERWVDVGDLVRGASSSEKEASIVRLVDTSKVRARFRVAEPDSSAARVGNAFRLTVDALAGREFPAQISRVSEVLDIATRTMLVEGDLPNPDGVLRAGMFGRVSLDLEPHENALVVRAEAVTTAKRKSSVLVVEDGKVVKRAVKIGVDDGISVEVLDGLQGQESVITTGKELVAEGDRVEAVPDPSK